MANVVIIANCHSMSIARTLSLGARNVSIDFFDLNFLGRENENTVAQKLYDRSDGELAIFSFLTSNRFSPVSTAELTKLHGDRLKTFSNIRFDGLHPDLTYIGPMEGRRNGLFGSYHSKIVLYSWANQISPRDCCRMFDSGVYEKLEYFAEFDKSAHVLLERDRYCDIKFAFEFLKMVKTEPCLYTFNHPTGRVFQRLASRICAAGGLQFIEFDATTSINELSNNFIWPIFNEIAEAHNLSYRVPQYYVRMQDFSSRTLSLEEMVAGSYAAYDRQNTAELKADILNAEFYRKFYEALS